MKQSSTAKNLSEKQKKNSEKTIIKRICLNKSTGCNIACGILRIACKAVQVAIPLREPKLK
jgi:hypothetical protein